MLKFRSVNLLSIILFTYLTAQFFFWVFEFGLQTKLGYSDVPISCNLDRCALLLKNGGPDYAYYINLANAINSNNSYIPISSWLLKAWPPGMGIYYAFLSKITFSSSYFLLLHIFIVVIGWSALLTFPILKAQSFKTAVLRALLAISLIHLGLFEEWLFSGFVIYSETLGLLLFFGFIVFFSNAQSSSLKQYSRMKAIAAGILLAMAAYVRIVFDLAAVVFLALTLAILFLRLKTKKNSASQRNSMRAPLIISGVFLLLTLPWRLFAYSELESNSFTFASNSNGAWVNAWTPTKNWEVGGNSYFVGVGINHLCVSYPDSCEKLDSLKMIEPNLYMKEGISAITSNPRPWIENRLEVFFNSFKTASNFSFLPYGWILSILFFSYSITSFCVIFLRRRFSFQDDKHVLITTSVILTSVTVMPLILTAFEPRYLYTLVILPWFILLYTVEGKFSINKIYSKIRAGFPTKT